MHNDLHNASGVHTILQNAFFHSLSFRLDWGIFFIDWRGDWGIFLVGWGIFVFDWGIFRIDWGISTTLEDDVETVDAAHRVLLTLADSVAARMRADGAKAYCVAVTIRSNDFKNKSHQRKLFEPTDGTNEIYEIAKQPFSELWNGRTPLRLLGISLTDLTKEEFTQTSLFAEADEKKTKPKKLDQTVDALRSKYGRATIQRGTLLKDAHEVGKKYKAQMEETTKNE